MQLNQSRNSHLFTTTRTQIISQNVHCSNCPPRAVSLNHPQHSTPVRQEPRSAQQTAWQHCMATRSPSAEQLSVENSSSLKNVLTGEVRPMEVRPTVSKGHFIPLETVNGFPRSLVCWCGILVSAQSPHTWVTQHGRTDSHFNLKTEPL